MYKTIAQQSITSPFILFYKKQEQIIEQINYIFTSYQKQNNRYLHLDETFNKNISNILNSNNIIFNDKKIILFNFVEIMYYQGNETPELIIKVLHPINRDYLYIITCLNTYYIQILQLMREWSILFDKFNGVLFETSLAKLNHLKIEMMTKDLLEYLIVFPFDEHFQKYLDKLTISLNKNIEDYQLALIINSVGLSHTFNYKFVLIHNKENLDDYDILIENSESKTNTDEFLKNLFYYGKI